MIECAALVSWVRKEYPGIPVGLTGISYGGGMVSCSASMTEGPLVIVPCCASGMF